MLTNGVDNPITSHSVRVAAFEFTLQGFTLERIAFKVIQGLGDSLIERGLPLCHTPDDALGLVGEFEFIGGQGMP